MEYKKTTLSNGLRIVTVPMKETQTATVVVLAWVGGRNESNREAGIAHLIEHMLFKGTKKRPTTLDIASEMDSLGGENNAFTSQEITGYYAKVPKMQLEKAIDIVADIYLHSKLDESEIQREKGPVLQELKMIEDTPMRNVGFEFEKLLYGKNPLGKELLGTPKTVKALNRKKLVDFVKKFYLPNNTVVCVAGNVDPKKVIKTIKEYFAGMVRNKKPKAIPTIENQKYPQLRLKYKKTDQTHFVLGVRAYDENHQDRFALAVLATILGGNMSSRMFLEIREKKGLAYYIKTSITDYSDCGYIETQAGVSHENLEKTIELVIKEYRKIASELVSTKELKRAKDFIEGRTVMGLESSDEVAMFFANESLKKEKIMTPKEILAEIEKVTAKDILRVAQDIFKNEKLNLAAIGPHRSGKKLKRMLKI